MTYYVVLCDKVQFVLHHQKQVELLEGGITFLQSNIATHCHYGVQSLLQASD